MVRMAEHRYWDEEFECRPWPDTLRWQAERLPALLSRLQLDSQLYADALDGVAPDRITSLRAFAELPPTSKDDLRLGQQPGQQAGLLLGRQQAVPTERIVQVLSSSGTTGHPVYFGLTESDRLVWANAIAAMFFTAGVRPSSAVALTTGMPIVAGGLPYADGIRAVGAALVWSGGQPTARMVTTLDRVPVDTLVATASFATYFAERVTGQLGRPASALGVRTIIAGGEPGMGQPDLRAAVLDAWGAKRVSEIMGLGDVLPGMWAECEQGAGMHFTAGRDVLVELIDLATNEAVPWVEGAEGELVYTTLTRQATPVLRFRSRDHVLVTGINCACGRATPRIRCVGRTDDMLIFKAMNVFPSAIRDLTLDVAGKHVDGIVRVRKDRADQVRFDQPIPLEVQLRQPLDTETSTELRDRIERAVRESLRVRVAVELCPPGSISVGTYKNALTYVKK